MQLNMIVAMDNNQGISKDGKIPWGKNAWDLRNFKELTTNNIIIMGRKTFLREIHPGLPHRANIVITNKFHPDIMDSHSFCRGDTAVLEANSMEAAIHKAACIQTLIGGSVWIIGGREVYMTYLHYTTRLFVTTFLGDYECDTFFPVLDLADWEVTYKHTVVQPVQYIKYTCYKSKYAAEREKLLNRL